MFLLTDAMIEQFIDEMQIGIKNFNPDLLNPTWYNFRVGFVSLWDYNAKPPGFANWTVLGPGKEVEVPGKWYASVRTLESFTLSKKVLGMFSQSSELALNGWSLNHSLAIDPGFDGTLEMGLMNLLDSKQVLKGGSVIGKLLFFCTMDTYPVKDPKGETANRFRRRNQIPYSDPNRVRARLEG